MISIIQKPDTLSLAGNLRHIVITSTDSNGNGTDATMTLMSGGNTLLTRTYSPDAAGRIEADLRDVITSALSFAFADVDTPYLQTDICKTFRVNFASSQGTASTGDFKVLRAGVDRLADTAQNFLTQNFLTWQPTVKGVTYYTPEFLTYYATMAATVKCKVYADGAENTLTLCDCQPGQAYTIPVGYAVIAGKAGTLPAYYDVWVENDSGQQLTYIQRYYAQDMRSEQEQWVLFENSLGGVDTFRAYGETELNSEHTHNVAEIEEVSEEYRVDTERLYKKSTGRLDKNERLWLLDFFPSRRKYIYAGQYLRQIVVTESDVNYKASQLPSSYNFTYKYADSKPYLNLPRTEVPMEMLGIQVPEVGSFTVAPRLVEFPRTPLSDGALFPIQNPYSSEWGTTTFGALFAAFLNSLDALDKGGGGIVHSHSNYSFLESLSWDSIFQALNEKYLSRVNADTAQETITFLKGFRSVLDAVFGTYYREHPVAGSEQDTGAAITPDGTGDFLNLIVRGLVRGTLSVEDLMRSPEVVFSKVLKSEGGTPGMDGQGIHMDASTGVISTDGLNVHGWMQVQKLVYNYLEVMQQDMQLGGGGDIEWVRDNGNGSYTLGMHKEAAGRHVPFATDDILYGKVDDRDAASQGYTYYTTWLRCLDVELKEGEECDEVTAVLWDDAQVPGGRNFPPKEMMTLAHRGNTTDAARQSFWEFSSTDHCITHYWRVDTPSLRADNIATAYGLLPQMLDEAGVLPATRDRNKPGLYVSEIFYEEAFRIKYPSKIVKEDRGPWTATPTTTYSGNDMTVDGTAYHTGDSLPDPYHFRTPSLNTWLYYRDRHAAMDADTMMRKMLSEWKADLEVSRVWHYGILWECLTDATTQEPSWGCTDWQAVGGDTVFYCEIASSAGTTFRNGNVDTVLIMSVRFGQEDITDKLAQTAGAAVVWGRNTGWDADTRRFVATSEDQSWTAKPVSGHPYSIQVKRSDMGSGWMTDYRQALFHCSIYAPDSDGETEEYPADFITAI